MLAAADNPLVAEEGYLWHLACLARDPTNIMCWHCNRLVYRPQYLSWGKDLIPLHERCIGTWVDACDDKLLQVLFRYLACSEAPDIPNGALSSCFAA